MHDIQDGLANGVFDDDEIAAASSLWARAIEEVRGRHPGFLETTGDQNLRRLRISNQLFGRVMGDLIETSLGEVSAAALGSSEDARGLPRMLIRHAPALREGVGELQRFLWQRLYQGELLQRFSRYARQVLGALFETYTARPEEMAPWYRELIEEEGVERAVCDYLAGMTDRFAERVFERLRGSPPEFEFSTGC